MTGGRNPACECCGARRLNGIAVTAWYASAVAPEVSDLNDVMTYQPDLQEVAEIHSEFLGGYWTRVSALLDVLQIEETK